MPFLIMCAIGLVVFIGVIYLSAIIGGKCRFHYPHH